MARKAQIVAALSVCTALITASNAVAAPTARADDLGTAMYSGLPGLRPACGPIGNDPRLTAAAQRHADDMLRTGINGHVGSDGSSPRARITQAGYRAHATGEIVYWSTGGAATPNSILDMWMNSPPHRAIILNCAFNSVGFATASDGNRLTAVGDFAS
jgi:uncharacterized protein YkwD